MNPNPRTVWPALEASRTLAHVSATWQAWLGEEFPAFRAAFLQPRPEPAAQYPCPLNCGCLHEVIHESPTELVACCRCERWNCDDLALCPEDVVRWELSWSRLGRALCSALGLDSRPSTLGLPGTRQVGSWSASAVPAILTLQPDPARLRQTIAELVARLRQAFILLTPTSRQLDAACLELLAQANAEFFDLESHVIFSPAGTLRPVKTPGEMFSRFTPQPAEMEQSVVERAFALVKTLGAQGARREPSLVAAFSAYCLDGLSLSEIARKFRCSRGTVHNRLALIRKRTGVNPDAFRKFSPQLGHLEDRSADSRAASIHRKSLIYDSSTQDEE